MSGKGWRFLTCNAKASKSDFYVNKSQGHVERYVAIGKIVLHKPLLHAQATKGQAYFVSLRTSLPSLHPGVGGLHCTTSTQILSLTLLKGVVCDEAGAPIALQHLRLRMVAVIGRGHMLVCL